MVAFPSAIARGDAPATRLWALIPSPLPDVNDAAWTRFVHALATQPLDAVSDSNGYGCFEMRPRALADLGLMRDLKTVKRLANGKQRQVWEGQFVLPLTRERFLKNPVAQYNALAASMECYNKKLVVPPGMSRSGCLAIMHRSGPGGLKSWEKNKFPATVRLYERCKDIF